MSDRAAGSLAGTTPALGTTIEVSMSPRSGPGALCPPTLLFLGGLVLATLLDYVEPLPLDIHGISTMQIAAGVAAIAVGIGLFIWGLVTFYRARTGIMLQQPASRLVIAGPYRGTRNPQYVGFIAGYVGVALLLNSLWALLLLPVVVGVLALLVIEREERYLMNVFGSAYENYCRSVGRWI